MNKLLRGGIASIVLLLPLAAQANHHLMAIREIYAGTPANPNSQYVLLQMRGNGQNVLAGHSVIVYSATGTTLGTYTFSASVASGTTQSFVYIATAEAQTEFGIASDLTMTPTIPRAGGRVCFDNIDCVAWGNYSASSTLPCTAANAAQCQTGTPFKAVEGLAAGRAARRNIAAGDANLLEAGDDTGNSSADFEYTATPRPTNNAGNTATAPTLGTGFTLNSFSDLSTLRKVGGAASSSGVLRLTPTEAAPTTGGLWHLLRQPVSGGLDTSFVFRVTQSGASGADGLSFVIQNESNSSLGSGSSGMGYAGMTNSLSVEFDTNYDTSAQIGVADPYEGTPGDSADPSENHVSIHSLGTSANTASEAASLARSVSLPSLTDGSTHTGRVVYVAGTLQVYVDDLDVPVARASVDLANLLQLFNGAAFVGFTGATAANPEDHDLLSWQLGGATVDTTPSAFSFIDQTGVEPGATVVSQPISVGGINSPVSISITDGEYRVTTPDGTVGAFTSAAGTVGGGDKIVVRHTAAAGFLASNSSTLSVGGVSDTFTSTTRSNADTTPEPFSFNDVSVPDARQVLSNIITVTGINSPTSLSLSGHASARFKINGGTLTSGSATVNNGDTVQLRVQSSASNGARSAILNIGGVSDTWTVTTSVPSDTTPDSYDFTDNTVDRSAQVFSNVITVSGINAPVQLSISGHTSARLIKNSGSAVAGPVTVVNGDTVQLRLQSSSTNGSRSVTASIGGVTDTWTVTTAIPPDTTPDAFDFTDTTVSTSTQVLSNVITVSGINANTQATLSGHTSARVIKNGGNAVAGPITVKNGDTLQLRLQSQANNGSRSATLDVGGISDSWTVTTAQ